MSSWVGIVCYLYPGKFREKCCFADLGWVLENPDHGINPTYPWGKRKLLRMKTSTKESTNFVMIENERTLLQNFLSQVRLKSMKITLKMKCEITSFSLLRALIASFFPSFLLLSWVYIRCRYCKVVRRLCKWGVNLSETWAKRTKWMRQWNTMWCCETVVVAT